MALPSKAIKFLKALEGDVRMSFTDLAHKTNIPETTCRRLLKVVKEHVDLKVVINPKSSRWKKSQYVFVSLRETNVEAFTDTIKKLRNLDKVISGDVVEGDFDLVLRVEAENEEEILAVRETISNYPHVKRVISHSINRVVKEFERPIEALVASRAAQGAAHSRKAAAKRGPQRKAVRPPRMNSEKKPSSV
jgi:DNA-binding Lrp family transcriptional regulator